jgi:hypothetical protein
VTHFARQLKDTCVRHKNSVCSHLFPVALHVTDDGENTDCSIRLRWGALGEGTGTIRNLENTDRVIHLVYTFGRLGLGTALPGCLSDHVFPESGDYVI